MPKPKRQSRNLAYLSNPCGLKPIDLGEKMTIADMSGTLGEYYKQKIVTAIVGIEADINSVDSIMKEISGFSNVEDEYVVTGEYDLILKVRFPDYSSLQKFLVEDLGKITGVKKTKTMMALSVVKESGKKIME